MSKEYGWDNPAPGTRLWRLDNHPETLTREDAIHVAKDLRDRVVECGVCGDYTVKGVEVHEVCLDMLSRAAAQPA